MLLYVGKEKLTLILSTGEEKKIKTVDWSLSEKCLHKAIVGSHCKRVEWTGF